MIKKQAIGGGNNLPCIVYYCKLYTFTAIKSIHFSAFKKKKKTVAISEEFRGKVYVPKNFGFYNTIYHTTNILNHGLLSLPLVRTLSYGVCFSILKI